MENCKKRLGLLIIPLMVLMVVFAATFSSHAADDKIIKVTYNINGKASERTYDGSIWFKELECIGEIYQEISKLDSGESIDVTIKSPYPITWTLTGSLDIPGGTTVDLDLGGNTIRRSDDDKGCLVSMEEDGSTFVLRNGTLTNGYNTAGGGGIHVEGDSCRIILKNSTIDYCHAEQNWGSDGHGGGICVYGKNPNIYLDYSHVDNNTAYNNGGGIYLDYGCSSDIVLANGSSVSYNQAQGRATFGTTGCGGGICVDGDYPEVIMKSGSYIYRNKALIDGGGIYLKGKNPRLVTHNEVAKYGINIIDENTAGEDGGGVCMRNSEAYINLCDTRIQDNNAGKTDFDEGGGIFVSDTAYMELNSSHIDYNTSGGDGGGISFEGNKSEIHINPSSTVEHNTSGKDGGGICLDGTASKVYGTGGSVSANIAEHHGGGIFLYEDDSSVSNVNVNWNKALNNGGGIYSSEENIKISGCSVMYNEATMGGGIFVNNDNTTIHNCEICYNTAYSEGGGVSTPDAVVDHVDEGFVLSGKVRITQNEVSTGLQGDSYVANLRLEKGDYICPENLADRSFIEIGVKDVYLPSHEYCFTKKAANANPDYFAGSLVRGSVRDQKIVKRGSYLYIVFASAAQDAATEKIDSPRANLGDGEYLDAVDVKLTAQDGADIHYTLDGSDPTAASTRYDGEYIHLKRGLRTQKEITLKAVAIKGETVSEVMTETYILTNRVKVPNGAKEFVFSGEAQTLLEASDYYTFSVDKNSGATVDADGNVRATDVGTYTVTAKIACGYQWKIRNKDTKAYEGTTANQQITVEIVEPVNQDLKITNTSKTVKAKALKKAAVKTSKVKVTGVKTSCTFKKVSGSKKLTVTKDGRIKVKKGTKKGTYKIRLKVTAKAGGIYKSASKTVTVKVKVK